MRDDLTVHGMGAGMPWEPGSHCALHRMVQGCCGSQDTTVHCTEWCRDAVGARISLYIGAGMLWEPGSHCTLYRIGQGRCASQDLTHAFVKALGARISPVYIVQNRAGMLACCGSEDLTAHCYRLLWEPRSHCTLHRMV